MSESFSELFEQSQAAANMRPGSIISGTVIDVQQDNVIVSAGLKSESWIPIDQFYDDKGDLEVAVGDQVDVALDAIEDGYGETRLSREKAKRMRAWENLEQAFADQEAITGMITERVKGGFTVEVDGIRTFLPGSLVDTRPVKDAAYLEGKPVEFKVIKLDRKRNNVVVSRRAVVEVETAAERQNLLEKLKEGAVIKGVAKNLTEYGAFLDLGGIDGLLHITDMAWKRVKDPAEVINVGDEVDVVVLKYDRERNRVSLGLKQLGEDPWKDLGRRYPEGTRLVGRVTNLTEYGCFVELEEGVEGLVHVSEMDWVHKNLHPSKLVQPDDEVEVTVLDIDPERRRISLGMKQCRPNPWEEFAAAHNKGDRMRGKIKSITDFGIFIGLDDNLDGLVHLSDLSWDDESEDAVRGYERGAEVEAVLLAVDTERERISLGIKQLEKDPFSAYIAAHPKGSMVTGKVTAVESKNVKVELAPGVEGQVKMSEFWADSEGRDAKAAGVKEGEELNVKVTGVDRKRRTISISVRAREADEESAALQEYTPEASSGAKLGDLLKEHLDGDGEATGNVSAAESQPAPQEEGAAADEPQDDPAATGPVAANE